MITQAPILGYFNHPNTFSIENFAHLAGIAEFIRPMLSADSPKTQNRICGEK